MSRAVLECQKKQKEATRRWVVLGVCSAELALETRIREVAKLSVGEALL